MASLHNIIKESINKVLIHESEEAMMSVTVDCLKNDFADTWSIVDIKNNTIIVNHIDSDSANEGLQVRIQVNSISACVSGLVGQFTELDTSVLQDLIILVNKLAEIDYL